MMLLLHQVSLIMKNQIQNYVYDRYTLDNFIVWPSNQLPFSACEVVVRNPWKSYNPLYIYWEVWLEKHIYCNEHEMLF